MGILRRLFNIHAYVSDELRADLAAEGLVLLDEDLGGSITFRNYRAPGRYSSLRKVGVVGAVAVSRNRLVVWIGKGKHIDVPHTHPLRRAVDVSLDGTEKVCFSYDPAAFDPAKSGRVEVRLRTPNAARYVEVLNDPDR